MLEKLFKKVLINVGKIFENVEKMVEFFLKKSNKVLAEIIEILEKPKRRVLKKCWENLTKICLNIRIFLENMKTF